MTFLDCSESPLYVGDDYDIRRTVSGIPDGSVVERAWLTIKASSFDSDAAAILQKEITTTPEAGVGVIEDDGTSDSSGDPAGTAVLLFQLTSDDTATLDAFRQYFYDVQIKTSTEKIRTLESGVLLPKRQATRTS